jgi:hypothetical protein
MGEDMTIAGAHLRIDGHEQLCSERWRTMNDKMDAVLRVMVLLFLGLLGWMAVQLYTLEPLRVAVAEHMQQQLAGRLDSPPKVQ